MTNDNELAFQQWSHDRSLNRNRNSIQIDGGVMLAKNNANLSPQAYQGATGDKSVAWELEKALNGIEELFFDE